MKKLLLILPLFVLLFSCEKEDDIDTGGATKLDVPTLQSPADGAELVAATFDFDFSWSMVDSATAYGLEIADNANFTNSKKYTAITNNQNVVSTDFTSGNTYYWRVNAKAANFTTSDFSQVFSFDYSDGSGGGASNAPTLLTPADNATVNTTRPTFTWTNTPLVGASYYIIQFAADLSFNSIIYFGQPISNTFTVPSAIDPLAQYTTLFWRVSADGGTTFSTYHTLTIQ